MFCVCLRKMYILLILDRMLNMSLRSIGSVFNATISLLILCLDGLSFVESVMLKSPVLIMWYYFSSWFCWYLLYIFTWSSVGYINIHSCCFFMMDWFSIIIKYRFLSHLSVFSLKSRDVSTLLFVWTLLFFVPSLSV